MAVLTAIVCAGIGVAVWLKPRPETVTMTTVHIFHHDPNDHEGEFPGTVAFGKRGTLYGTTSRGGTYGAGTVFKVDAGGAYKTLYTFQGPDGAFPDRCLIAGVDSNFYGTTGFESYQTPKRVFRVTPGGPLSTVAFLYPVQSEQDRRSVLVKAIDGQIYVASNVRDWSFDLLEQASQARSSPVVQIVPGWPGSTGMVFFNDKAREAHKKADQADAARPKVKAPPPLCGEVIPTRDGHFWGPQDPFRGTGIARSVSRDQKDSFYLPVDMYLRTELRTAIENPRYPPVGGAFGRLAEDADGVVWATSRQKYFGQWGYEIVGVTADGQVARRIALDPLGVKIDPQMGLLRGRDGLIYGLAFVGDDGGIPLLYRTSSTGPVQVLYRFANVEARPAIKSPLVQGPDGSLYVTFVDGGKSKQGAIYRVTIRRPIPVLSVLASALALMGAVFAIGLPKVQRARTA